MRLQIEAYSDKGRVRDNNEDMLSVGGYLIRDDSTELALDIPEENGNFHLLVSDGMGGHENGEYASQYLLENIAAFFNDSTFGSAETFQRSFEDKVQQVSASLNEMSARAGQQFPMGCTLTGTIWVNGHVFVVNSGDSRTYRFRNGRLTQLTTDENERGIADDPNASKLLLGCVGGGCAGLVKMEDITDRLIDEDMILICSDGLIDEVSEDEIVEILKTEFQPATALVERAKDNGGHDNISVIVAVLGNGEFAPEPDGEDRDDDGRYDAWA